MNTRPRWLWWVSGSLILLVCVCIVSTLASYLFCWSITGFPNKTIWDWLQLLIIPVALAASALIFNWFKARTERQIALDKQREDLIQSYLDRMSELLLEKGLGNSKLDDEVRKVARARTISVLRQLDGGRVGDIFTFLQEAELVDRTDPIIHFKNANFTGVKWHKASLAVADLSGANLSEADLSNANLYKAVLNGANLSGANLSEALLSKADLRKADLNYANLRKADLIEARLIEAGLCDAKLIKAILAGADLRKADLSEADLRRAILIFANLSRAVSCEANLSKAKIFGANLSDADLSRAKLQGASLDGADLSRVDFSGANLRKAGLKKADLRCAKGLTREQLTAYQARGAIIDEDISASATDTEAPA